jgi:outer membrane protein, heavy metal efflux system
VSRAWRFFVVLGGTAIFAALSWMPPEAMAEDGDVRVALSAETEIFHLEDAAKILVETHPALQAMDEVIQANRRDAVSAGLWQNPQLSTHYVNAWQSSYDPAGMFGGSLSQFVELSGAPSARRRSANWTAQAAVADYDATRNDLLARLTAAAVTYAAALDRAVILRDTEARLLEVVRIVDMRVADGTSPRYDRHRIVLARAAVLADVGEAEADVLRARGEFLSAVGPGAEQLHGGLALSLAEETTWPPLEILRAWLQERRPDLVSARARVRSAEANVTASKRSVFPGIGISFGTIFGAAPGQLEMGGGITVPLPVIDRGQGQIPAAEARLRAAQAVEKSIVQPDQMLLPSLVGEIQRRILALRSYREQVRAVDRELLGEALAGYQRGKLNVLDLADAFSFWKDAQIRAIEVATHVRLSEAYLAFLLGDPMFPFLTDRPQSEAKGSQP